MKAKVLLPFILIVLLITPERNLLSASSKEDKAYVNNICGKNKVILNKDIPIADQLNKRNTIYVVKHAFDFNDANKLNIGSFLYSIKIFFISVVIAKSIGE